MISPTHPRPPRVALGGRRPVLVEQAGDDRVRRAEVRDADVAQGWPSTAPGTPVFVEYFGWSFVSGRMWWTAWATAIAASA